MDKAEFVEKLAELLKHTEAFEGLQGLKYYTNNQFVETVTATFADGTEKVAFVTFDSKAKLVADVIIQIGKVKL